MFSSVPVAVTLTGLPDSSFPSASSCDLPCRWIGVVEGHVAHGRGVGARVDDAGQRFAVPVEIQEQALWLVLGPPLAAPLSLQRMAELRNRKARHEREDGRERDDS